mgnify:CR=1 FL=1
MKVLLNGKLYDVILINIKTGNLMIDNADSPTMKSWYHITEVENNIVFDEEGIDKDLLKASF